MKNRLCEKQETGFLNLLCDKTAHKHHEMCRDQQFDLDDEKPGFCPQGQSMEAP